MYPALSRRTQGRTTEQPEVSVILKKRSREPRKLKLMKIHKIKDDYGIKKQSMEPTKEYGNLLIDDIFLMKELWELQEDAVQPMEEQEVVDRLEAEGVL
ncbi:hypothetical protein NDU88_001307 [Pleurodeles waltl]|uniref:Uncharacterized protein n=1 Tax=Pleurodeles waltl TaxID=8319 RepID=A0AAV7M4Z9_PLEWA|nr:hypothetical protein NDU88_001307 [Pleurodeles waltl]